MKEGVDKYLSYLKNVRNLNIISARQASVDCINIITLAVGNRIKLLQEVKETLEKARQVAEVADVEQLEGLLEEIKVIVETLEELD
jgi:hypothetical protein